MRHDSDSPVAPLRRGSMKPPGSEKSYTARAAANLRWYSCESVRDKCVEASELQGLHCGAVIRNKTYRTCDPTRW